MGAKRILLQIRNLDVLYHPTSSLGYPHGAIDKKDAALLLPPLAYLPTTNKTTEAGRKIWTGFSSLYVVMRSVAVPGCIVPVGLRKCDWQAYCTGMAFRGYEGSVE